MHERSPPQPTPQQDRPLQHTPNNKGRLNGGEPLPLPVGPSSAKRSWICLCRKHPCDWCHEHQCQAKAGSAGARVLPGLSVVRQQQRPRTKPPGSLLPHEVHGSWRGCFEPRIVGHGMQDEEMSWYSQAGRPSWRAGLQGRNQGTTTSDSA